jgi:ABC-2 type transport system ATP-binding protein
VPPAFRSEEPVVLTMEGVTKRYRTGVLANDGVDLRVADGEVFGLLGHNGAGKTTLVNQIVGLLKPDDGRITVAGIDAIARPAQVRALCSLQAQANVPLTGITPRKAVELIGRIRGGRRKDVRARVDELMAHLRLEDWADRKAQGLSGGVNRLVAFCMAVVVPGRLVVLDEPTNDVDPVRRRLLWEEVRRLADTGCTVLLVTHNVTEAERTVDRIAILDQGRTAATGSPSSLKRHVMDELRLDVVWEPGAPSSTPPRGAKTALQGGRRSRFILRQQDLEPAAAWAQRLREAGCIEEFSLGPATLEDVYIDLVGHLEHSEIELTEVSNERAR